MVKRSFVGLVLVSVAGVLSGCPSEAPDSDGGGGAGHAPEAMAGAIHEPEATGGADASEGGAAGQGNSFDWEECSGGGESASRGVPVDRPTSIGFLNALAPVTGEGVVESVDGSRVTIVAGETSLEFVWVDDSLAAYFAPGDAVQLEVRLAPGGGGALRLSILETESASVAALDGYKYAVLSTQPSAPADLEFVGFPSLRYGLRSCCGASELDIWCDYSQLTVTVGDESVGVDTGQVERVGDWSVGNWGSHYLRYGESTWFARATFIGPAQD